MIMIFGFESLILEQEINVKIQTKKRASFFIFRNVYPHVRASPINIYLKIDILKELILCLCN